MSQASEYEQSARLLLETIPRTMRLIRMEMREAAGKDERDFTVPQFRVLNRLTRNPSTNRDLAAWMGVSAPSMSKMIDKLVERGYAKRATIPGGRDRRQVHLTCTKKGAHQMQKIRAEAQKRLEMKIAALDLSRERLQTLENGLELLKEIFQ